MGRGHGAGRCRITELYARHNCGLQGRPNMERLARDATTLKRMTMSLLMIEDDSRLAQMVVEYLAQSGFEVTHAPDGEQGLEQLPLVMPELVVLDLMMPGIDGLEVCRRIRSLPGDLSRVPVIMLTAKGDPMDRIIGLELGADDYLPKPFEPRELLARIRAVLRRRGEGNGAPATRVTPAMRFGSLEIDRDARTVQVHGEACELTSYQFDLLVAMAERAGRVLTRDQIMEAVRGRELEAFDRSIDVHIGRIRNAIEADSKEPKRILTVRGVGYVFAKQQD
jgi:two-component system, OmpR family, phosphate regulon response regulator OmpR